MKTPLAAIYARFTTTPSGKALDAGAPPAKRRALVESGLGEAIADATKAWGADWSQWRYGRLNTSRLPHI